MTVAAPNEEYHDILDALTQIKPSLLITHFLQFVLEEHRPLSARFFTSFIRISAATLSHCFGWIGDTEVVLVVPRLVELVDGDASAKGVEH